MSGPFDVFIMRKLRLGEPRLQNSDNAPVPGRHDQPGAKMDGVINVRVSHPAKGPESTWLTPNEK